MARNLVAITLPFTAAQVERMRAILGRPGPYYADGCPQSVRDHVQHCFDQLVRFSLMSPGELVERGPQFGLNLGRAQEILGAEGGVGCWWRLFEPRLKACMAASADLRARDDLLELCVAYIDLLGLEYPLGVRPLSYEVYCSAVERRGLACAESKETWYQCSLWARGVLICEAMRLV